MESHDMCDIWEFKTFWLFKMGGGGYMTFERDFEI